MSLAGAEIKGQVIDHPGGKLPCLVFHSGDIQVALPYQIETAERFAQAMSQIIIETAKQASAVGGPKLIIPTLNIKLDGKGQQHG